MSDKYLDKPGISELWTATKKYIEDHSAGSTPIVMGDLEWNTSSLPESGSWSKVLYANGIFVAVKNKSTIGAYSSNGIDWTEMTMPSASNWYGLAYGNGRFVATGGFSHKAAYSLNGKDWTEVTMPSTGTWNEVVFGNGKFVSVSDTGSPKAAYSTDGISWTVVDTPASKELWCLAYGNGVFVSAEYGGSTAVYSTDGITWKETQMPFSSNWIGISYSEELGIFVAITYSSGALKAAYSYNGTKWYSTDIPYTSSLRTVAYGGGKFVALEYASNQSALYSADGITWIRSNKKMPVTAQNVTYGNGRFVAVTFNSNKAMYSSDIIQTIDANKISYDNASSGLAAKNVQSAIDEIAQSVLPEGGKTGQVLTKRSDDDYDVYWADVEGGVTPPAPTTGHVFGVMWDSSNPNTALTRLTNDNDPNGCVNTAITEEPVAGVGGTMGSSQFDNYLPWSGMEEYNIINNAVSYKRGQDGFSRTLYDTVVYIPDFWCLVIQSGTKWYWYISDSPKDGFQKHPGSGRYVGRYNTGAGYVSKSGLAPLTNITRAQAREGSHSKGSNWWQYDYATWCAIWLLCLVEYADWDSQKKIGRGWVDAPTNQEYCNSGLTDAMAYHTGRSDGEDGKTAVQYRGIENPWGNLFDIVDGFNVSNSETYISLDNASYQDVITNAYTYTGILLPKTSGHVSEIGYSEKYPWSFIPVKVTGSGASYIPDLYFIENTSDFCVIGVGGSWINSFSAGMFYVFARDESRSTYGKYMNARLLYIPKEVTS